MTVYRFSSARHDASPDKQILGGKGAHLVEMASLGLPVPPGFIIPTSHCAQYQSDAEAALNALWAHIPQGLSFLSDEMGSTPLLSVRSGAPVSMPGMMDTILNVGLTSQNLDAWKHRIGDRAALDSRRRLIEMMGETAFGLSKRCFEENREAVVASYGSLTAEALDELISLHLESFRQHVGVGFPDTLHDQLDCAVRAVFGSWNNERAVAYRKMHGMDASLGTAVVVQAMVFGNMGNDCGTGVAFTRDPSTGEANLVGEFLTDAQGEDVVSGGHTPHSITALSAWPAVEAALHEAAGRLEAHNCDMMDLEFTIQQGQLYLLQCRAGKRTPLAAVRIAMDLFEEGRITRGEVFERISRDQLVAVQRPRVAAEAPQAHLHGLGAGVGIASGRPVFSAKEAAEAEEPVVLIASQTSPDDIEGMQAATGIITAAGGVTCHAAVLARSMGKPAAVGVPNLFEALSAQEVKRITLDAETGRVWLDTHVPLTRGADDPAVQRFLALSLAAAHRPQKVTSLPSPLSEPVCFCAADDGDLPAFIEQVAQLPQSQRGNVTIDLRGPERFMEEADRSLLSGLGVELGQYLVEAEEILKKNGHRLSGVRVIPDYTSDADALSQHYAVAMHPQTVSDLVEFSPVFAGRDFVDLVIGNDDLFQRLMIWMEQHEEELEVLREAVPAEYLAFSHLDEAD